MPFSVRKFSECRLDDQFFDSLKEDYKGFENWFEKKSKGGETAYVHNDEDGRVQAFLYIKDLESEAVGDLIAESRMKIGTLKINRAFGGRRLGEGAIGIALWKWQRSDLDRIYVTVFPKHDDLINILETYGFDKCGKKGEEFVFMKDKKGSNTTRFIVLFHILIQILQEANTFRSTMCTMTPCSNIQN